MVNTSQRNQSLDVLRCIAILLVIGFHLPYYDYWGRFGWIGVDLFFVLSGFLISGLLFQEYKKTGSIDLKRFLIRRGLKIYPSFYLLIVTAGILSLVLHSATLRSQTLVSAVFAQGYFPGSGHALLSHTWSIAVEEHFYLLLPLLLLLLISRGRSGDPFRAIPGLFLILVAICFAFRWYTLPAIIDARMTHMRIDALLAGVALGYFYHFRRSLFDRFTGHYALMLATLMIIPSLLLPQRNHFMQTFGLTGLLFGFSFLVAWSVVRTPKSRIGRIVAKSAAWIGFYSYSIYLWHTALLYLFLDRAGPPALLFWGYLAACVVGGVVMAHLIEMPYLALRERLFPNIVPPPQVSAAHGEVIEPAIENAQAVSLPSAATLPESSPNSIVS
jgi:peptidoglycan/LPS O-acetylase OafA/YrhL